MNARAKNADGARTPMSNKKFLWIWVPVLATVTVLVVVANVALNVAGGWVASQLGSGTYTFTAFLLVVPFVPSDAASRVQGTVDIKDGKYTIEADSAETGETWQIDQDGTITPAGE